VLAAPVVNAGADATLAEGAAFARTGSFGDPDSQAWTARVDYGDGAGPQTLALNSDRTFQLNHAYADNGAFTVTVTVTDGEQELGSDRVLVNVQNVVPNLFVRGRRTVAEGLPFTVADIGMFTDPGLIMRQVTRWNALRTTSTGVTGRIPIREARPSMCGQPKQGDSCTFDGLTPTPGSASSKWL